MTSSPTTEATGTPSLGTVHAPMLVDGAWVESAGTFDVHDPADESLVGTCSWCTPEAVLRAADAASRASAGGLRIIRLA